MKVLVQVLVCCMLFAACQKTTDSTTPEKATGQQEAPASTQPVGNDAAKLLDQAIAAHGGEAKLAAARHWQSRSSGVYMGMPYRAVTHNRPGAMRMDVLDEQGQANMSMMWGEKDCWNKMGPVVMECDEQSKKESRQMQLMQQAYELLPLKDSQNWKLTAGEEKVGDKQYRLLEARHTSGFTAKLFFNPQSHLLERMTYQGTMMGRPGEFVVTMAEHREFCGVKLPSNSSTSFAGQPYVTEKIEKFTCAPQEEKLFARPQQVADGTVVEKQAQPGVLACLTHQGPYDKLGEVFGKLGGLLAQQQLTPMGPPLWTYLQGPPKVKDPNKFVTEVCFPVASQPPAQPEKKGELTIKAVPARKVLAVYGLGDYQKKSPELIKKLLGELKKRKLKAAGPFVQVGYHEPGKTPPEKVVSELQVPLGSE